MPKPIYHRDEFIQTTDAERVVAQALLDRFIERGRRRLEGPAYPVGTQVDSLPPSYRDDFYLDAKAVISAQEAAEKNDLGPLWVAEAEVEDEWNPDVVDYQMMAVPEPMKAVIDSGKFYLGERRVTTGHVGSWRLMEPGEDTNGWWIIKGER